MKPGIYYSLSADDYHAMREAPPMFSASTATVLCNETPLHAWTRNARLNPNYVREEKDVYDIGHIAHSMVLEGGTGKLQVFDVDDWRTKAAREAKAEARANGLIPMKKSDFAEVAAMVKRTHEQIAASRDAKKAFDPQFGKPEVTVIWIDDGVLCKARIDWLHDSLKFIDDYKTVVDANPDAMSRKILNEGLDIQEAIYRRGIQVVAGIDPVFRFICQEKSEPYALSVIGLNPQWQWHGELRRQRALSIWKTCLAENNWPGYPAQTAYPVMPKWIEDKEINEEMRDGVRV